MRIISPEWEIEYLDIDSTNNTVAELLFECAKHFNLTIKKTYWEGYKSYLIEAINGIENGENNMYWQYYVNGEYANVGCSNYLLKDNDVVIWRFEPSKL
jgi:hypothetical protein